MSKSSLIVVLTEKTSHDETTFVSFEGTPFSEKPPAEAVYP
jgi:hypothetical protein